MLDKIKDALNNLKTKEVTEEQLVAFVTKLVHSRIVGWLVSLTGTKNDDAVLTVLKEKFPK